MGFGSWWRPLSY